jgi:hypothetical protein
LFDLQEPLIVDNPFACVEATDEVSKQRVVYFKCVTENGTRSGID